MAHSVRALVMIWAVGLAAAGPSVSGAQDAVLQEPRLDSLLGRDVATAQDGDSGRIIDLLADDNGRLKAAVVEFGGFLGIGTRKIAVDWTAFRFGGAKIIVDVSRDQLRRAPEYKLDRTPLVVGSPEQW